MFLHHPLPTVYLQNVNYPASTVWSLTTLLVLFCCVYYWRTCAKHHSLWRGLIYTNWCRTQGVTASLWIGYRILKKCTCTISAFAFVVHFQVQFLYDFSSIAFSLTAFLMHSNMVMDIFMNIVHSWTHSYSWSCSPNGHTMHYEKCRKQKRESPKNLVF